MKLLIVDNDSDFKKRFSRFVAANCEPVTIDLWSDANFDSQLLKNYELVLHADNVDKGVTDCIEKGEGEHMLLSAEKSCAAQRGVYKYQSAVEIIKDIPLLYELSSGEVKRLDGEVSFLTVTGFEGGCGKTSFSVMLARLSQQILGKRTLIITLSQMSDLYEYFRDVEDSQNILAFAMQFAMKRKADIRRYLVRDIHGVYVFRQQENYWSALCEMDAGEVADIIKEICKSRLFDTVIFDLDNSICDINHSICEMSDKVFILHEDGRGTRRVSGQWEKFYLGKTREENVIHIDNFVRELSLNELFSAAETEEEDDADFYIPYESDSFFIKDGVCDMSMTGMYSAAVGEICREVFRG